MRIHRVIFQAFFATTVAVMATPHASACINDRSVKRAETEFRSRYESTAPAEAPPSDVVSRWAIGGLVAGSALVAGSLGVGFRRKKSGGR